VQPARQQRPRQVLGVATVVRVDLDGLLALLGPRLSAAEALASGSAEIDGDASVFGRCTDMLAWPARDAGRIAK
jgi:hypothetical protein